jgi:hypothetical protein
MDHHSRGDLYGCVIKTVKNLKLDKPIVLDILEESEEYKGITKLVKDYELCLNHPSRHLNGLSGPNELCFFNDISEDHKRILLLGEYHSIESICTSSQLKNPKIFEIQKWLVAIAENAPSCIDIFAETPYKTEFNTSGCAINLRKYNSPLSAVECHLSELKNRNKLPKYLRYHNVDTRVYEGDLFPMVDWDTTVYNVGNGLLPNDIKEYDEIQEHAEQYKKDLISYMLGIDRNKYVAIYGYYIRAMFNLIQKPLDAVKVRKLEKKYFKSIDKAFNKMTLDKVKFLDILLGVYMENYDLYTALLNIPMDLYVLTRLFIKFDSSKMSRGPKGCRDSKDETINNVIIYGGSNHTNLYKQFLVRYFNKTRWMDINGVDNSQCLRMNNFDFFTS